MEAQQLLEKTKQSFIADYTIFCLIASYSGVVTCIVTCCGKTKLLHVYCNDCLMNPVLLTMAC